MTIERLRKITEDKGWRAEAARAASGAPSSPFLSPGFDTYWIESGHRIREQIGDDALLTRLIKTGLAPYEGGPLTLYRGESIERWLGKAVGFCWSPDIEIARMFAGGLNAMPPAGGVVLVGHFEPYMVICGPNGHSRHLGEEQFTVDPVHQSLAREVERFPPWG